MGIKSFQTEYNMLPKAAIPTPDEKILQRTRGRILLALLGKEHNLNPYDIVFFEPPVARGKQHGLYYDENNEPVLVDPWGEPYYFVMDLNNDGKVPNRDSRPNEPRELPTTVIVFSSGPDRDPNTWKDNITTWR